MGESACLVHSFSCAATISHESHEDNPLHALNQSISFGRFMSESLDWEKWSTFTHKKYVEEAERYSRPGSVAQKKAFFEAHYKKKTAAKKAATELLKQQVNNVAASENAPELGSGHEQEIKEQNTEKGLAVDADGSTQNDNFDGCKVQMDDPVAEKQVFVENSMRVGSLNKQGVKDNNEARDDVVVPNGIEQKEDYMKGELLKKNGSVGKKVEGRELLKKNGSVDKKDEDREMLTKNLSEFRMSVECSTPPTTPNVAAKHTLSEERSERRAQDSVDKASKSVHRRWHFVPMNCLCTPFGLRTEEQYTGRNKKLEEKCKEIRAQKQQEVATMKDKPKRKLLKLRCSLCFMSELHK